MLNSARRTEDVFLHLI